MTILLVMHRSVISCHQYLIVVIGCNSVLVIYGSMLLCIWFSCLYNSGILPCIIMRYGNDKIIKRVTDI